MNQLFNINAYYTREEIDAIGGNRLRDLGWAVLRFDDIHWALILDEQNSWGWQNSLPAGPAPYAAPAQLVMGINPGRNDLNEPLRTASSRGERTWVFYRRAGEPADPSKRFRFIGEVWCADRLGDFLVFNLSP